MKSLVWETVFSKSKFRRFCSVLERLFVSTTNTTEIEYRCFASFEPMF